MAALGLLAAVALAPACQRGTYQPQAQLAPITAQPVGPAIPANAQATATIAPYRERVVAQMTTVLGNAPVALPKIRASRRWPTSWATCSGLRASRRAGPADTAGRHDQRRPAGPLPAGPVTVGSVFELMPFENQLVVLDAPGAVVQQLFDYAARLKMAVSGATLHRTTRW